MRIRKGASFLAKGPLRITVKEGAISSRLVELDPKVGPLIVRAWETFDVLAIRDSDVLLAGRGSLVPRAQPYPPEWVSFLRQIPLLEGSRILVSGQTDAGKTTLSLLATNTYLLSGKNPCIIDADIGQSHIGPPATVGLGRPKGLILRLSEAELLDASFVGDTSPAHCFPIMINGIREMVSSADRKGDRIIMDTCGLVSGSLGRSYARRLLDAFDPDIVLCVGNTPLSEIAEARQIKALPLPPLPEGRKDAQERRVFRLSRYLASLSHSSIRWYDLSHVVLQGLVSGRPETLRRLDPYGLRNALVGLHTGDTYRGIGVIHSLDEGKNVIGVLTTVKDGIDRLVVGNLIIEPEGERRVLRQPSLSKGRNEEQQAKNKDPDRASD